MYTKNIAFGGPPRIIYPYCAAKAIYSPLDLDDEISSPDNFSLTRLCCKEIIRDAVLLEERGVHLPPNLYPALMSEALRYEFRKSAESLIRNWPLEIISISELIPDVLAGRFVLLEWEIIRPRLRKAKEDLLFLLDLFFQIVRETSSSRLRVLDLRGVTLGKDTMKILVHPANSEIWMDFDVIESDKYHIIVDCQIWQEIGKRVNELLNLYRDKDKIKIRLHFSKLVLNSPNDAHNLELFKTINPTEIIALCVGCFCRVILNNASSLRIFSSLVALNLSFLNCKFNEFPDKKNEILPLESMPHLRRLGVKYRRNNLAFFIPISTLRKLEYLDISSAYASDNVRIIGDDLRYLTSVPLNLRELYLRENIVIESNLDLWRTLLRSLAPTLRVLDMDECFTNDKLFGPIVSFILPLNNLRMLHLINRIIFAAATLLEHVPQLGSMPRLKWIQLFYAQGSEYVKIGSVSGYVPDEVWRKHIDRKLAIQKSPPVMINWRYLR